jgi:3-oxoacyl-[acyl-carrier protein] reductase
MDLSGRAALVTGGSRGIGRAIALKLAGRGADIAVSDILTAEAEAVAEEVRALGRQAVALTADVSVSDDVTRMVTKAKAALGKVDILVNNAGIARDGLLLRMTDEDWDKVIAVDLRSVFLCTRAVLRDMTRQRWGRIINISSVSGLAGNPGQANYAAAKAGIVGFTRTIAKEMASRSITVNAIAPGLIDTGLAHELNDQQREAFKSGIPMGCLGTADDIAGAAAFLASEDARYITGQVLAVDGGMVLAW